MLWINVDPFWWWILLWINILNPIQKSHIDGHLLSGIGLLGAILILWLTASHPGEVHICGKCNVCQYVLTCCDVVLPDGQIHSIAYRVICQTIGVVYLGKCLCGWFYVGKTKHPFYKRIKDHTTPISKHLMHTAFSQNVGLEHNFDTNMIMFMALEHVPMHVRGGSINCTLLQLETCWIYNLNATRYPGLNEYTSFK